MLATKAKVDLEPKDRHKRTPLWLAAKSGHHKTVKYLLETGRCNPNSKSDTDSTPLHEVASNGHIEVVRELLATGKADPWAKTLGGKTPIYLAKKKGHREIVEELSRIGETGLEQKTSEEISVSQQTSDDKHQGAMEEPLETSMVNVVRKRMLIRNIFNKNNK